MLDWAPKALKAQFADASGLSHELLHVYCGLSLQLTICVLLGLRISSATPLYFVYMFELFNELLDITGGSPLRGAALIADIRSDVLNTVMIPTIFFALARWTSLLK